LREQGQRHDATVVYLHNGLLVSLEQRIGRRLPTKKSHDGIVAPVQRAAL